MFQWKQNILKIVTTEKKSTFILRIEEKIEVKGGPGCFLSLLSSLLIFSSFQVGDLVGYQIRLESSTSPNTLLTFCTNGVLLRTLMGGLEALSSVTHIIVDEIHERDKFSDFLLTVLRDALKKFPKLKLLLMSATVDSELFT